MTDRPRLMNVDTKDRKFRFRMKAVLWERNPFTHTIKRVSAGSGGILFMVFLPLLFGCGEKRHSREIQALEYKLGSLERRLAEVEVTESKIDELESRIKGFQNILTGLENSEKALDARIDTLNERISRLLKEKAPVKAETPVDTSAEKEASPPETQKGFHIVRSGETLYRIAMMYGVSVADLRRLNNLSEMQFIFPGQKLRVPRDTP